MLNHSQVESLSKNYYKVRWTVITNCDSFFITKCDKVYYKLRQVSQSAMDLLQIATGITKCDDYYKLRQYRYQSDWSVYDLVFIPFSQGLEYLISDVHNDD